MAAEVELILGRAGSGKTYGLHQRIFCRREASQNCFSEKSLVIVADQETFETECALSARLGGGLYNCSVYSWDTLARTVLDETGERRAFLSTQGRIMLMRSVVDSCGAKLKSLAYAVKRSGFAAACDEIFVNFKRCSVSAQALKETAERLPEYSPLREKLMDFSILYAECENRMHACYIDPEDMMNALYERFPRSSLANAHVYIDGGDTMNEQSYTVLGVMLDTAPTVTITLDYDSDYRYERLFAPDMRTLHRIEELIKLHGCKCKRTILPPRASGRSEALLHLESELYASRPRQFSGSPEGLSVYIAADRRSEVVEAAERIKAEAAKGMRYRDMTVVVSDLSGYASIIERVFKSYGIPYFTDIKRSVATHPLSELIIASLTAIERGFDSDSVLRVLKTGFFDIERDAAERLENYIIASGLGGKRLLSPIESDETPLEVELARKTLTEPLVALRSKVSGANARDRAIALYDYMVELDVLGKQRALCEQLHEMQLFTYEEENAQVVNTVLELLDQIYVILGDSEIGLKRFISIIKEGLAAYEVGIIPTTCDQVLVGNIGRTRSREVEFLQVLGMNDGLFPKKRSDDAIIDDSDLSELRSMGLPVWDSIAMLCENDMRDIYSALSKPKQLLRLSYPVNTGGEAALPCSLLDKIIGIFPNISITDAVLTGENSTDPDTALIALAAKIRRMIDTGNRDNTAALLYSWFKGNAEYREPLNMLMEAFFHDNSPLPLGTELAKRLYGTSLHGSASRLEAFNACPFKHYVQYGLSAKERREYREKVTDEGTFYHAALESYTGYILDNCIDWASLDDEQVLAILRDILPPLIAEHNGGILLETARQRARCAAMLDTIRSTACAMTRQIAAGSFRPKGTEIRFGLKDSALPALRINLPEGSFYISGIIDRVDSYSDGESERYRIVDYKKGGKDFDYAELKAGLQLQLPLYAAAMSAVEKTEAVSWKLITGEKEPVGMYYMPVTGAFDVELGEPSGENRLTDELMKQFKLRGLSLRDESVTKATDSRIAEDSGISFVTGVKRNRAGELSGSGLVDRDEFDSVIDYAKRTASDTIRGIFDGHAEISPYKRITNKRNACRFCPFDSICRFDPNLPQSSYRIIRSVSEQEFFGRQ